MGKHGKKQKNHRQNKRGGGTSYNPQEEGEDTGHDYYFNNDIDNEQNPLNSHTSFASKLTLSDDEIQSEDDKEKEDDKNDTNPSMGDALSKFSLYQQSVQSPKGDISYLQKFFLMYVGGRLPLHLQEDFCGTALLSPLYGHPSPSLYQPENELLHECYDAIASASDSCNFTEWLCSDARRTAVGLDLDLEALNWCMENNVKADGYSRISLFHGNVLQPLEAILVKFDTQYLSGQIALDDEDSETVPLDSTIEGSSSSCMNNKLMKDFPLPARDIVCAFNYSCCCLHSRRELVSYFKHAVNALSKKGGIFVMDLYGGTSSECELRLQRRFPNFTYVWEQAGFDIIQRKTRISLHFHLQKPQKKLCHAFSYSWRLWSLPEIKDCLEEAGFRSVHFWIREMPDTEEIKSRKGMDLGRDVKYEEVSSFEQQDSWNAYIVGVA